MKLTENRVFGMMSIMTNFNIESSLQGSFLVLRLKGYFEKTAGEALQAEFEKQLPNRVEKCLLDLTEVSVINSPGLTKLLEFAEALRYDRKIPLGCIGVTELYEEVFNSVGFMELTEIFPDEITAREALK